jgi:hypothetical protein
MGAGTMSKVWDGKWAEVFYSINEIEWFASRKIDLAKRMHSTSGETWADSLMSEVVALRELIAAARKSE